MQPVLRRVQDALRADLLVQQAQRIQPNARRLISAFLAIVVLVAAVAVSAIPSVTNAAQTNVLVNGSFESGFSSQLGCGSVGNGWNCFTNGGAANFGFHDDSWQPVLADGNHAQLVSIDTKGISAGDNDRYAGIYQTVRVVHGAPYTLNLRGLIRSTRVDGDPYRYVVQVGTTAGAFPNWAAVTDWKDTGWYTYYPREAPGALSSFSTDVVAADSYITVYVRVWKKWASAEEELNVNLDGITLTGEAPYGSAVTIPGAIGGGVINTTPGGPIDASSGGAVTLPGQVSPSGCYNTEMVYNGNFEQGFNATVAGAVGKGWGFFTNGGAANFSFNNDQWARVVADGVSSQLMSIDTNGRWPADRDRYIGIFQHVTGLIPGQTYELSLKGILRGSGPTDDPYRFEAQWGTNSGGNTNWMQVSNWTGINLGPISSRTDPAPLSEYRAQFVAPATTMTLFFRGWSKWPISDQEMNLNLDVISIRGCSGGTVNPPPSSCIYIVRPGDTLSKIAQQNGTTVAVLMRLNGITNPNIIYVGQQIKLPNCGGTTPPPQPPPTGNRTWLVRPGDTLGTIAKSCGVSVWALAQANGITNPNLIFVGQVLRIP